MDRHGAPRIVVPGRSVANAQPRISPDGRRIAIAIGYPPYASDIWVYDIASKTLTPLTTNGTSDRPEWTPDGRRIAWTSNARGSSLGHTGDRGIWWQPWDASSPAEFLLPDFGGAKFSPRQDFLVAGTSVGAGSETRLVRLPIDPKQPSTLLMAAGVFRQFRLSRDGHWLAYVSDESGLQETYIQPVPGPGGRLQISSGGGAEPVWSPSGRELFYRSGPALISATITLSPQPAVIRRDTLFKTNAALGVIEAAYDVAPDGQHFIMLLPPSATPSPILIQYWTDEVRAKVASASPR
jgi:Tol biopolymer transport system component